ncbi:UNVERIFIED_CONTAM: hypothetical protein GTU68_067114, partial [Idotea baltica]|nr:hypothetical protein [Idotea baltica]
MNTGLIIFISFIVSPLLWGIAIYNQLITLKNNTKKSWSNIDVLLKQRNSELPKLIDTCKQHMKYEQETLVRVIAARQNAEAALLQGDVQRITGAEHKLSNSLMELFAVAEDYPELKASDAFLRLQTRITTLEDSISDRREFYNESAAIMNTRCEQFPDNIVA